MWLNFNLEKNNLLNLKIENLVKVSIYSAFVFVHKN